MHKLRYWCAIGTLHYWLHWLERKQIFGGNKIDSIAIIYFPDNTHLWCANGMSTATAATHCYHSVCCCRHCRHYPLCMWVISNAMSLHMNITFHNLIAESNGGVQTEVEAFSPHGTPVVQPMRVCVCVWFVYGTRYTVAAKKYNIQLRSRLNHKMLIEIIYYRIVWGIRQCCPRWIGHTHTPGMHWIRTESQHAGTKVKQTHIANQ